MGKSDKKGKRSQERPAESAGAASKNAQPANRKTSNPPRQDRSKPPPTGLDAMKAALQEAAEAAPKEARPRPQQTPPRPRRRDSSRPAAASTAQRTAPESKPRPTPAQPHQNASAPNDEPSPPTRRSTPRPPAAAQPDVVVPPLPRVRVEQPRPLSDDELHVASLDAPTALDATPVASSSTPAAGHAPPRFAVEQGEDEDGQPSFSARPTERHLTPGYDLDGETATHVAPIAATAHALRTDADMPVPSRPGSPPPAPPPAASVEDLEQQIRDLEARLDRMIRHKERGLSSSPPSAPPARPSSPASSSPREPEPPEAAGVFDTARELLSTDYYLRQWGRMGMRNRSEEVDEFGLDPKYEARWQPFFDFLYRHYFRVDIEGTSHIPDEGRCLIVANHSGGPLPYDGPMLRTAVKRDHPHQREVRWLAEDFIYYLPFVGAVMNRLGAVRACQENAERLLTRGNLVAVFPEGAKGMGKLYRDRYQLQRFGRGGFIRLCLRTQTPIVPCAIVGAEEANPIMYRIEAFTKAIGLPYLPITPTFPALGPLGLLPAPTKWKIRFGEPISFDEHGVEAADDEILVSRLADRVRTTIQGMLDRTLSERASIWFG